MVALRWLRRGGAHPAPRRWAGDTAHPIVGKSPWEPDRSRPGDAERHDWIRLQVGTVDRDRPALTLSPRPSHLAVPGVDPPAGSLGSWSPSPRSPPGPGSRRLRHPADTEHTARPGCPSIRGEWARSGTPEASRRYPHPWRLHPRASRHPSPFGSCSHASPRCGPQPLPRSSGRRGTTACLAIRTAPKGPLVHRYACIAHSTFGRSWTLSGPSCFDSPSAVSLRIRQVDAGSGALPHWPDWHQPPTAPGGPGAAPKPPVNRSRADPRRTPGSRR